jgi:hypothetical protein
MRFKSVAGVSTFYCPDTEGGNNTSHYEVESDGKQTIQHIYAFPYAIDNFSNATRSRVYHWKGNRWHFIAEMPYINPQSLDILRQYLHLVASQ